MSRDLGFQGLIRETATESRIREHQLRIERPSFCVKQVFTDETNELFIR